jgi:transposase
MKHAERVVRNEIILKLSKLGFDQTLIGEMVNLSQQTVSEVLQKAANNLPMSIKSQGLTRRLSEEELKKLPGFLEKGVMFYGFEGLFWTHARVGYVIKKELDVTYENKQVGRILALINWTSQKPQKKDAQQSSEKVAAWKEDGLKNLKKKQ